MALRDISITLRRGTPEWPGDTPYDCRWSWQMSAGASVNVSAFSCSPHVGTHADAPLHVADGAAGAHALRLEAFAGPALVADVRHVRGAIRFDDLGLGAHVSAVPRLLLRTGRTIADGEFPADWPVLAPECLQRLTALGLQLVGVDCPSVDERESKALPMHHAIFGAGVNIVENLDLRDVEAGAYELLALPLKLEGLDAAPLRAALRSLPDA